MKYLLSIGRHKLFMLRALGFTTRKLSTSDARECRRMLLFTSWGSFVHTALALYYLLAQHWLLLTFSAVAVPLWLFSIFLAKRQRFKALVIITAFLILIHLSLGTLVFGTDSGIYMGLWPLSCIFPVNQRVSVRLGIYFALSCLILFLALHLFGPQSTSHEFFPYSKEVLIVVLGSFMVMAIMSIRGAFQAQRRKLEQLANHDALTGLYNRAYFSTFLNYQRDISVRERSSFCVAIGDIDYFKSVNDTYGHDMGDKVLKTFAQCFQDILAKSDAVCRWGGEEFVIFIPESTTAKAFPVMEAIREVLSEQTIGGISCTMSFGLVQTNGRESIELMLKRADELLYQAKSYGRNNVQHTLRMPDESA